MQVLAKWFARLRSWVKVPEEVQKAHVHLFNSQVKELNEELQKAKAAAESARAAAEAADLAKSNFLATM